MQSCTRKKIRNLNKKKSKCLTTSELSIITWLNAKRIALFTFTVLKTVSVQLTIPTKPAGNDAFDNGKLRKKWHIHDPMTRHEIFTSAVIYTNLVSKVKLSGKRWYYRAKKAISQYFKLNLQLQQLNTNVQTHSTIPGGSYCSEQLITRTPKTAFFSMWSVDKICYLSYHTRQASMRQTDRTKLLNNDCWCVQTSTQNSDQWFLFLF